MRHEHDHSHKVFNTTTGAALLAPLTMHAFDRGKVERFATLPPGEAYPEGIDADADGNVT